MWPLPGHDDPVPKLSYVKLFEPWGWVVGTGIYLDDVDLAVKTKEAEIKAAIASQRNGLIGTILTLLALTAAGIAIRQQTHHPSHHHRQCNAEGHRSGRRRPDPTSCR
jgi:signal transduction histidine kinase